MIFLSCVYNTAKPKKKDNANRYKIYGCTKNPEGFKNCFISHPNLTAILPAWADFAKWRSCFGEGLLQRATPSSLNHKKVKITPSLRDGWLNHPVPVWY